MDHSSSVSKAVLGSHHEQHHHHHSMSLAGEESGWTSYFEELEYHGGGGGGGVDEEKEQEEEQEDGNSCCSSSLIATSSSSSMVSDAASFPKWKSSHKPCRTNNNINVSNHHHVTGTYPLMGASSVNYMPKKLSFMKKTRAKEFSCDDSLEDTASSPVSSPKVSELAPIEMNNPRKINDHFNNTSLGKGGNINGFGAEGENSCAELKKRGLCLVPFSLLVNYLG